MAGRPAMMVALVSLVLALNACSGERERAPRRRRPERNQEAPPPSGPGSIEGVVRYRGAEPPPLQVRLTGPRAAQCREAQAAYEAAIVRGEGGGLADVFVMVEGAAAGEARQRTIEAKIERCVLEPFVIDGTVGDVLTIRNADDHAYFCGLGNGNTAATEKQRVLPGQTARFELDRAGGRRIDCSLGHPWLLGHLLVARHPFHAVTDREGRFRIDGVPSGGYRVQAWHATQRKQFADVRIVSGEVARLEVVYRAVGEPEVEEEPVAAASSERDAGGEVAEANAGVTATAAPDAGHDGETVARPQEVDGGTGSPRPAASVAEVDGGTGSPRPAASVAAVAAVDGGTGSPRERALAAIRQGREALAARRFEVALERFTEANRLIPTAPAAHRGLGDANMGLRKNAAAIRAFRMYLLAAPAAPDAARIEAKLRKLHAP